jgi:hypothetical protein
MQMQWVLNMNSIIQHLAFEVNGQHIWEVHKDLEIIFPSYVTKNVFVVVKSLVKNQCKGNKTGGLTGAIKSLIRKLFFQPMVS